MYRATRRQVSLLDGGRHLPPETQRRLAGSWAEGFQREVFPVLLQREGDFAGLYSADNGRPNWSVATLLGICILQEWFDLSDQQALDDLAFDARWQVALGLTPAESYLSRRSLVEFRSRLVRQDPKMERIRGVFRAVSEVAIERLKLGVSVQRLDSTRVVSNIRTRGRIVLFQDTLTHLLRWVERHHCGEMARLSPALEKWYQARHDDDRWPEAEDAESQRRTVLELAVWLMEVIDLWRETPDISSCEPYQLVVRLFSEHCERLEKSTGSQDPGGSASGPDERVRVLPKPAEPGTALQSPYDPEAGYGHKGQGYHVQIAETCANKVPDHKHYQPEIITDYQVHSAGETDHDKAIATLDRLAEGGVTPTVLVVDAGYVHGGTLVTATEREVELRGPANRVRLPKDSVGRDKFTFDPETGEVLACPQGHAPLHHVRRTTDDARPDRFHAKFDGETCRNCPLRGTCVARPPNSGKGTYYLDIEADLRARDARLAEQKTPEWREAYKIRAGIEATHSELKRHHGLGRLRVRRGSRVELAVAFKVIACNAKRWTRAVQDRRRRGLESP